MLWLLLPMQNLRLSSFFTMIDSQHIPSREHVEQASSNIGSQLSYSQGYWQELNLADVPQIEYWWI